jgi:hypothetical protein
MPPSIGFFLVTQLHPARLYWRLNMKNGFKTKIRFLILGAIMIVVIILTWGLVNNARTTTAQTEPKLGQAMLDASPEQVAQLAIKYSHDTSMIVNGKAEIVLTRKITGKEFNALDLGSKCFPKNEPPMVLVILKGEFTFNSFPGFSRLPDSTPLKYVAYLFDLKTGYPASHLGSPNGGMFSKLLNDPSLRDVAPPQDAAEKAMPPAVAVSAVPCSDSIVPEGAYAPTVTLPKKTEPAKP